VHHLASVGGSVAKSIGDKFSVAVMPAVLSIRITKNRLSFGARVIFEFVELIFTRDSGLMETSIKVIGSMAVFNSD